MPFLAEDGTGIANANALISVAFADDYHTTRQNSAWGALSTDKKQGNIVNATDYLFRKYTKQIPGQPFTLSQGLPLPRLATNSEAAPIPAAFKEAVAELALINITTPLFSRRNAGDTRIKIEETTGPITDKWAAGTGNPNASPTFDYIEEMIADFLMDGFTGRVYVERA